MPKDGPTTVRFSRAELLSADYIAERMNCTRSRAIAAAVVFAADTMERGAIDIVRSVLRRIEKSPGTPARKVK